MYDPDPGVTIGEIVMGALILALVFAADDYFPRPSEREPIVSTPEAQGAAMQPPSAQPSSTMAPGGQQP